ncbi:MAG: Stk1 family PASTA domain-containing Ser/Thr kinase [Clostridia bacterium]|nr:Stk1 family PASTA domain-containing Ser/Thr kinase [Clostridia bacterium]
MNSLEKYVGQIFDERYKIIKIIGVGGMAVVFEAFDTKMNRIVAVKVLKDEIADDSQSVKRFINESKAVAMLSHPNIVKIFDVSVKDNLKYIVMEYVDGITLKSYMNQKGKLSIKETISYTEQILRALEHAHAKGIIHRDIKPQNIMLLKNGKVKVTDFGIAKLPNAETVTMTDKAIGTVYYISPEQASGQIIDRRSDLYSVGVMMYEMLTGKLPFDADSPVSVALMQINNKPTPPRSVTPEIPKGLEQIILLAMEKSPDTRFQSAEQMLAHLIRIKNEPSYVFRTRSAPTVAKSDAVTDTAPSTPEKKLKNKSKNRVYSMFPIILGIFTALILVCTLSALRILSPLLSKSKTKVVAEEVTVPNVVGQIYNEALGNELIAKGFRISIEYDSNSITGTPNTILEQSPKEGEKRKVSVGTQYADLSLVLSIGEGSVTLNDQTVKDYREVKQNLEAMGLICKVEREYNDNIRLDYVIRTNPGAGSRVPTGSTVTIYVSKGSMIREVQVPNLIGLTEEQASAALDNVGLKFGSVTYEESENESGTVVKQSVTPYETVFSQSTVIDVVISK